MLKLTARGVIQEIDFPLMRHLYGVVAEDEPLDMPWETFFGGEPVDEPPERESRSFSQ